MPQKKPKKYKNNIPCRSILLQSQISSCWVNADVEKVKLFDGSNGSNNTLKCNFNAMNTFQIKHLPALLFQVEMKLDKIQWKLEINSNHSFMTFEVIAGYMWKLSPDVAHILRSFMTWKLVCTHGKTYMGRFPQVGNFACFLSLFWKM